MSRIHTWQDNDKWFWDDAENHGGFDACVPSGPFDTEDGALKDAADCFGSEIDEIITGEMPSHYP